MITVDTDATYIACEVRGEENGKFQLKIAYEVKVLYSKHGHQCFQVPELDLLICPQELSECEA